MDENEILARWREKFWRSFEPIRSCQDDTHKPICLGQRKSS